MADQQKLKAAPRTTPSKTTPAAQNGRGERRPTQPTRPSQNDPQDEAPDGMNLLKWGLGCTGLGMLLFTGATMFMLIVTPVIFRNLLPEQQASLMTRFPFLTTFKPTRVYQEDTLPTVETDKNAALALLNQDGTTTPEALVVVPSATPTSTPEVIQPTSILATNTPVVVSLAASPTPPPTATLPPTIAPTNPPAATTAPQPIPAAFYIDGYVREKQKWNNCGPANMTQVLRWYGWTGTQKDAQNYLKPNNEDKNVSPWQMVSFVNDNTNQWGLKSLMRVGGNIELLKRLVASNFGVIVEKGSLIPDEGWMGHYLTVAGYDETQGGFYGLDTYLDPGPEGRGQFTRYSEFDAYWKQFNRVFIVVYPTARERELAAILGDYANDAYAVNMALSVAKQEASVNPADQFAWFNLGSTYVLLGEYQKAVTAFDMASSVGDKLPFRMLWYQFARYEAHYNLGQFQEVLNLAHVSLTTASLGIEETYYWQGMAYAAKGDSNQAIKSLERSLNENPNYWPAKQALAQVQNGSFQPPAIAQKK